MLVYVMVIPNLQDSTARIGSNGVKCLTMNLTTILNYTLLKITPMKNIAHYCSEDDLVLLLKTTHEDLGSRLQECIQFGRLLSEARGVFRTNRKRWQMKETSEEWIENTTEKSRSYIRGDIQMYRFVMKYLKLQRLNVSFTKLYKM